MGIGGMWPLLCTIMSVFISTNPPILRNNVSESDFSRHFPRVFKVRSLNPFEALKLGLSTSITYWEYLEPFEYISDKWGSILVPAGFITDFASVPPALHSIYDNDSPILLYPSAPHDLIFTHAENRTDLPFKPTNGRSRGWLHDGRQLTLQQANEVLVEAMFYCGADSIARGQVFGAVQVANLLFADEFGDTPAK